MSEITCYLDGEYLDIREARVSVLDRGHLMGDAVYEVTRVQNGRLFRARQHYERMARGLGALGIPTPFTAEAFEAVNVELLRRNGIQGGLIYIQVSRGATLRTHLVPKGLTPTVFGYSASCPLPKWRDHPEGVTVITSADLRWQRCDIKTTMLLPNSLAKQEAVDAGCYDVILVAEDGTCREGSSSSLFIVSDGALRTHPADNHILPGITRQTIIEIAGAEGIPLREETFRREQLLVAEEAMLVGTTTDVCPVVQVDGKPIGEGRIGPVTQRLIGLLAELIEREVSG